MPIDAVLEIGLGPDGDRSEFDMTGFSLRLTNDANAVSQLHAQTADATWTGIAPHRIRGVTNGIHVPSWMGNAMGETLDHELDADLDDLDEESEVGPFWEHARRDPDRGPVGDPPAREARARDLRPAPAAQPVRPPRRGAGGPRRARERPRPGHPHDRLRPALRDLQAGRACSSRDLDRLARILWNEDRPVQVVFAGKAHPADRPGQQVIQEIFGRSRSERLRGRVFILEDYDIRIARYLVAGVDVWLNNPRRPLEASGTSGMKAAMNGAVNVSVLDGWWDEGWIGDNGWAIGGRETNPDEGAQDWSDAQDLYRLLEEEIVPRYYERDAARPAGRPGST